MTQFLDHFGFGRVPFRKLPPREAFPTADLRAVADHLTQLQLLGGIGLCVGEAGAGKTYAVEAWAQALGSAFATVWIEDPGINLRGFLRRLTQALGIAPCYHLDKVSQQLSEGLRNHSRDPSRHLIFAVDEAQLLPVEVLEQIRRLTNLAGQDGPPVSFVLIGHREFLAPFGGQKLLVLRRRLTATAAVAGLTREELDGYVGHHLDAAGATVPIFSEEALEQLWSTSWGLPRVVNTVAVASLLAAARAHVARVDATTVRRAAAEQEALIKGS